MIETKEALSNLDEIMSTPDLDGIYIGPADLSLAIGAKPGFDNPVGNPTYVEMENILKHSKKNNIVAGIHNVTPEYAEKMIKIGFQFVTVASDKRLMAGAANKVVNYLKKKIKLVACYVQKKFKR